MSRRLVITADDCGRDPITNEVILGLLRDGHVTATTLLAVAPAAADAADALAKMGVQPHVHMALTRDAGTSWAPLGPARRDGGGGRGGDRAPDGNRTRSDENSGLPDNDGLLPADPAALASVPTTDVLAELAAQRAWCIEHSLRPAACDSHSGTLYGLHGEPWLGDVLQWCAAHCLAFRLPRDPVPYLGPDIPEPLRHAHVAAVAGADALGVALPEVIITNQRSAADLGSYEALRGDLITRLREVPDGTSELFLHPSGDGALGGDVGTLRAWEARLLRDEHWHGALEAEGIELVSGWWT